MTVDEVISRMQQRLNQALMPSQLSIIDETHKHRKHAGYQPGKYHFVIEIASPQLQSLSRLEQHRKVYAALGDLMQHHIHALRIRFTA